MKVGDSNAVAARPSPLAIGRGVLVRGASTLRLEVISGTFLDRTEGGPPVIPAAHRGRSVRGDLGECVLQVSESVLGRLLARERGVDFVLDRRGGLAVGNNARSGLGVLQ